MGLLFTAVSVFAFLFLLFIVRFFLWPRVKYAWADKIPGPPRHWLFGTLHLTKPGFENLKNHFQYSQQYGPISRMWIGPVFPLIVLYHPTTAQSCLVESQPKGSFYNYLRPWLGNGVLTAYGATWKRKRRMVTPAFHFQVLKGFQDVFHKHILKIFKHWDGKAERQEEVDTTIDITHLTLDVIGECAFAYDIDALSSGRRVPYVNAVYRCAELMYERTFSALHSIQWVYDLTAPGRETKKELKVVYDFITKVLINRREVLEQQMKDEGVETVQELIEERDTKPSFIDILFSSKGDDGELLGMDEVVEETNTFMFEGHDTTSSGLSFALYYMCKFPHIQERVYEEVSSVLGPDGLASIADLNKLSYTKCVLEESLRLSPVVPIISRELTEPMEIGGYAIPSGAQIMIHPWVLHRQPDIWENAEEFDPSRFTMEGRKKQGAYDYIPFSAGPRNCVGQKFAMQEELTVFSALINRYRLEMVGSPDDVIPHPTLVLRPLLAGSLEGFKMKVTRR